MQSVLIVEPSLGSSIELIEKTKKLGYQAIVMTYNNLDRRIASSYLDQADKLVIVDTNDENAVFQKLNILIDTVDIAAVLPGSEYYVALAAKLSARLGLIGLSIDHVNRVRHKNLMRESLKESGLRVPLFSVIKSAKDLTKVANEIGFPCVIKPVDCSGSLNVRKVYNLSELQDAYELIVTTTDVFKEIGRDVQTVALVEEFLEGPEYSVEGVVQNKETLFFSITEKHLGAEPHFVEIGHIVPAPLNAEEQSDIRSYVSAALKALHLNVGPFHCELRLTKKGPVMIEVGARLPGDRISHLIKSATGEDLQEAMLKCYLGHPVSRKAVGNLQFAGIRFFVRPEIDTFHYIEGWDALKSHEGVVSTSLSSRAGVSLPESSSNLGRLGYVICTAASYAEISNCLNKADASVQFIKEEKVEMRSSNG